MTREYESLLYKTVKWLTDNKKIHICIHDMSGLIHNNPVLELPFIYKVHANRFCNVAKTTAAGMRTCLRCKAASIRKAMRLKTPYYGSCYLGMAEIVVPVHFNDKPVCIIYLGNLRLDDNARQQLARISKICSVTGVDREALVKELETAEAVQESRISEYMEICSILKDIILLAVSNDTRLKTKSLPDSPEYRDDGHWVIQSVKNYVSAYYNRNLKLSYLAKLYFHNPQYLCRLFKKETGVPFTDFVNQVRINQAKHLLALTDHNIVDISLQAGYNNVTYFNRLFKEFTGMTPGEYRSSCQRQ